MERLRRNAYILFILALSLTFLYLASDLVLPIALAGLLAMLCRGVSNRLEARGWSRWLTALTSVVALLAGLGIVLSLLAWQASTFMDNLGEMRERVTAQLAALRDWVQEVSGVSADSVEEQTTAAVQQAGGGMAEFAAGTLSLLVDVVLVVVYLYLLLFYRSRIKQFIIQITPQEHRKEAMEISGEATLVAQQYLSGLMAMIAVLWVMYGIGFSVVGVEGALFFAVLCGVLEIVPFVGNLVGTSITVLAVVAQGGDTGMLLGVIAVYFIVQGVQTYLLEPLIVGRQVRLNPLFTIIALVAGELFWGIAGMILAVPVVGIIKICCDHIPAWRPYGYLIGTESQPPRAPRKNS